MTIDFAGDMRDIFLDAGDFAETVLYKPASGRPRNILAIVDRTPPTDIKEMQRSVADLIAIEAMNDASDGIDLAELKLGRDQIRLPVRAGQPAEDKTITRIISHDAGALRLELR